MFQSRQKLSKSSFLFLSSTITILILSLLPNTSEAFLASFKNRGMGDVGVAYPQDALAGAYNPAAIMDVGFRVDAGFGWVNSKGNLTIENNLSPINNGTYDNSKSPNTFFPVFGFNYVLPQMRRGRGCSDWNYGFSFMVYSKDHLKVNYKTEIPLIGTSPLKTEIIEETAAFAFASEYENHCFGFAVNFIWQNFIVEGFENFDNPLFSINPGHVTNNGRDNAYGIGFVFGYLWHATPCLTFGVNYEPKTHLGKLDKYDGLLVDGHLDLPERGAIGFSYALTSCMNVAFDVQRIQWSHVASLGHPIAISPADLIARPLGSSDGPGFGWSDQTLYRLGTDYELCDNFIVRAGFLQRNSPIRREDVLPNVGTMETVKRSISFGFSWWFGCECVQELSGFYTYGISHKIDGSNIDISFGGGEASISNRIHAAGISYGYVF